MDHPSVSLSAADIGGMLDHLDSPVHVYARSLQQTNGITLCQVRVRGEKKLLVASLDVCPFEADKQLESDSIGIWICPRSGNNADMLRELLPWTAPVALGTTSAIGCGDRLGLASPGHIRACSKADVVPVLAQQSIREMQRTGRTPEDVLNDATWAVFEEGYEGGFGADADHLKTPDDIDVCYAAGFTMYTLDPSDFVNNQADRMALAELERHYAALPWHVLGTSPADCLERYLGQTFEMDEAAGALTIGFDERALKRAAVKYGAAVAHAKSLADHLAEKYNEGERAGPYDLELSVDETDHPTRPHEHYFVAAELERLGVEVTSLAPRFTGDFQKAIDFIGDTATFEEAFEAHCIIAQHFGGYKLSIHSGSDKFTVFPIIGRRAGSHVHLKTAGTSFLEALRLPARHAADFFRAIVDFAFERFDADRKTYHVTTDLSAIPTPSTIDDDGLEETYLDEPNARQLLHITYGSILSTQKHGRYRFKDRFFAILNEHEEEHYDTVRDHFRRHIDSLGHLTTREELRDVST